MTLGFTGKIIVGTCALATSSIRGTVLYKNLKPMTIGEELQTQENRRLLDKTYDSWSTLIQKYENSNENPKTIEGLNLPEAEKEDAFIKKCHELWNTSLGNENANRIKGELKNWCVDNPEALTR